MSQENMIYISNARLSFPNIAQPQTRDNPDGTKKVSWNCELLLPQNDPGYQQFMKVYATLAQAKWAEHAQQVMQMIHQDRKQRCYGSGDEKVNKKTFKPYDGYAGNLYITTGSNNAPQLIRTDGTPVDPANSMEYQAVARAMYGGCYVNVAIKPWLQDNKHGRGVRCDLVALQFAKDGEPFGEGAVDASGMFGAVAAAPAGQPSPAGAALPAFMMGQ
jgi:hypothetical protein